MCYVSDFQIAAGLERKKSRSIRLELLHLLFEMVDKYRLHTNVLRLKTAHLLTLTALINDKRPVIFINLLTVIMN